MLAERERPLRVRAVEWFLGGPPAEVLEGRAAKALVALAVAGILLGAGGMVAYALVGPEMIHERFYEDAWIEFTIDTRADSVTLVIAYAHRLGTSVDVDYNITRPGDGEVVAEGTLAVDQRKDARGAYDYVRFGTTMLDLGRPGRYNVTLSLDGADDEGTTTVTVFEQMVGPSVLWGLVALLLGALALMVVLTVVVHVRHRRHAKPYVSYAPFLAADLVLGLVLLAITLGGWSL